jgi:mannan endo-1,4-beta-mannosidase
MERGLVTTSGIGFVVNGESFPVVGVNCYFLGWCGDGARKDAIQSIRATGANVIRVMGFLNTPALPASGITFQYKSDDTIVINDGPSGLQRLDSLIAAAEQNEMRLIIPLVNYWNDLGGMQTYLEWLFPGMNLPVEEFYRRPEARNAFKDWLGYILNRSSSVTGIPYRESPAILGWELTNEARCPIAGGRELLLDWAADMSQFVKRADNDPNHLLALGDEGFLRHEFPPNSLYTGEFGVDFDATLDIPQLDFGTYHFYPAPTQMNVDPSFGETWIRDHVAAGKRVNKPVILEEYGIRIGDYGVTSAEDRDRWYADWQQSVYRSGGAGDLLWMMGCHNSEVAGYQDEYTVYSAAEIPSVSNHVGAMGRGGRISPWFP